MRTGRERTASGVGLALAWHGAGFTGSGEVRLASVASIELTAEGQIRILTASTEMGQGTKTILPQLVAEALDVPIESVEVAPQDTEFVPEEKHWSAALQRKLCNATLDLVTDLPHGLEVLTGRIL